MACCARCGDAITARGSVLDVEGPLRARLPRPVALCPDCGIDFVDWLRGGRSAIPARLTRPGARSASHAPAVKRSTRGPTDPHARPAGDRLTAELPTPAGARHTRPASDRRRLVWSGRFRAPSWQAGSRLLDLLLEHDF